MRPSNGIRRRPLPRSYAEQTHASPYWIVRWPHEQRLRRAGEEILRHRPATLLDYGAGDLGILRELEKGGSGWLPERVVAFEPVEEYARLATRTVEELGLEGRVEVTAEVDSDERFDFITCLSVLEHMPMPERMKFYSVCRRDLSTTGLALIDVPCEIGPTILVKELARRKLKGRASEFSAIELLRYAFGAIQFDPQRWNPESEETWILWHTGFDHRLLEKELRHRFQVVDSYATPLPRLPSWLGNQEVLFLIENPRPA